MKNKKYFIGISVLMATLVVLPLIVGAAPTLGPPNGVTDANFNSVTANGIIQNSNLLLDSNGNISGKNGSVIVDDADGLKLQDGSSNEVFWFRNYGGMEMKNTNTGSFPYGIFNMDVPVGLNVRPLAFGASNSAPYGSGNIQASASGSTGKLDYGGNVITTGGLIDGGSIYLNRADTNNDGVADATAGADLHLDGAIKNDSNAGFHYGRVLIDDELDISGRIRTSDPKITGSYTTTDCTNDGGQPYSPPAPGASQVCLLKVRFSDGIDVGGDVLADKVIVSQGITANSLNIAGPISGTEFPDLTLTSVYSFFNPTNSTRTCAITGVLNSCGMFTCRYYTCLSPV